MNLKKVLPIIVAVLMAIITFAQEKKTGTISGVVKKARSKSPLIEAVVTLSSDAFNGQKFALTDSSGMYTVSNLPAGNYTISSEMEGYEKSVQNNINLQPGMTLNVNFEMMKERRITRRPNN